MDIIENIITLKVKQALKKAYNTEEIMDILQKLSEYQSCKFNLEHTRIEMKTGTRLRCFNRFLELREELMSL